MKLPLIIDNHFDGIGDAVCQCWVVASARAAGYDVRLNIRKFPEIGYILGMEGALTVAPGVRWFVDKGQGYHNWAYERQGVSRIRAWLKAYGLPDDIPLVRPTYTEHDHVARWANCAWGELDAAHGDKGEDEGENGRKRIVIFPECAWPNRTWPRPYFIELARSLRKAGHTVLALVTTEAEARGFPVWFYGLQIPHLAATIHRADLVIGNDSGPAHIAGTIGTPTLALFGPTSPEVVFGHLPEVRICRVAAETMDCVGCHFTAPRYREACAAGCQALYALPWREVEKTALRMLAESPARAAAA